MTRTAEIRAAFPHGDVDALRYAIGACLGVSPSGMTRPEYMTTVLALIVPPSTGKTEMVRAAAQAQQAQ